MSDATNPKILLIDDDELILAVVGKMLQAGGFSVEASVSARDALALLAESSYDAIVCDMWMPGMTGKELYQQLAERFPQYQNRTVFLTGDTASEATWDFIEEKSLPYVLKPVNAADMVKKLRQLVGEGSAAPSQGKREKRRGQRIATKARARVRETRSLEDAEIVEVLNASEESTCFLTNRQYSVGVEVRVSFPYTGINDIETKGYVVRVEERTGGQRAVALAVGAAAEAVSSALTAYQEQRSGPVVSLADSFAAPGPSGGAVGETARVAELKVQIAQAHREASALLQELALSLTNLKPLGEQELFAAKSAVNQLVEDLRRQIRSLRPYTR